MIRVGERCDGAGMTELANLLLQNQILTREVKRRVDQISAINAVAAMVGLSLNLDETLETALESVTSATGAEAAGISIIDKEANELVLRAQKGWVQDFVVSNPMRIPLYKGMSGKMLQADQVLINNNLDDKEQFAVPSFRDEHFRSIAMAPMHARTEIVGILSVMSHLPNQFDPEFAEVLQAIADTVGVAIDNARLYEGHVEQETRLDAIIDSTADGIIATDKASRISLVNHAAERLLDIKADDLIGSPLREANIPTRIRDQLILTLPDKQQHEHEIFQVTLENERVIAVLVSSVQVESQVEQELVADGWVIVLQDVTHIREAEIARAQFIQAAAHDMRNPLTVTQSSITMLDKLIEQKSEDIREVIDMAYTGIDRLQKLIDDLLKIEQIESGYGFHLAEADIREICDELCASLQTLLADKKLTFKMTIAEDVPKYVEMDSGWVSRSIQNFLDNARKYVGLEGHIELKLYVHDSMLHIDVVDNGPGISAAAQARLFERFYRVNETDAVRGSGLGLAIVKSVAEAHGGTVYVRSQVGKGSTFGLTLPLARAHDASPAT